MHIVALQCNSGYAFGRETVISLRSGPLSQCRSHVNMSLPRLAASCIFLFSTLISSSILPLLVSSFPMFSTSDLPIPLSSEDNTLARQLRCGHQASGLSLVASCPLFIQQRPFPSRLYHPRPIEHRARVSFDGSF